MRLLRPQASRAIAVALASTIALASCGGDGGTAPAGITGHWTLTAVAYQPLPQPIAPNISITAGELDFRSRGRVLDIQSYWIETLSGGAPRGPDTVAVSYELSSDRIILKRSYRDGRAFSDTGEVDLENGGMLIRARDVGPARDIDVLLLYNRI